MRTKNKHVSWKLARIQFLTVWRLLGKLKQNAVHTFLAYPEYATFAANINFYLHFSACLYCRTEWQKTQLCCLFTLESNVVFANTQTIRYTFFPGTPQYSIPLLCEQTTCLGFLWGFASTIHMLCVEVPCIKTWWQTGQQRPAWMSLIHNKGQNYHYLKEHSRIVLLKKHWNF